MRNSYFPFYQNKTIGVTGASGYLGSALVKRLQQIPCSLRLFVRDKKNLSDFALDDKTEIFEGDVRDNNVWEPFLTGTDVLFHLAAQTSLAFSEANPKEDFAINVSPIISAVEIAEKLSKKPAIIFAGTATQVGVTENLPVHEKNVDHPATIYDRHKCRVEEFLKEYVTQKGGAALSLRLANVYGPGGELRNPDRGIVNQMIYKAIKEHDLVLFDGGKYLRDYVFIEDACEAFLMAGANPECQQGDFYYVASGKGYSIKELAFLIAKEVEVRGRQKIRLSSVEFPGDPKPIEKRNFVAQVTKIEKEIGWKARTPLELGIEKTIDYFLEKLKCGS